MEKATFETNMTFLEQGTELAPYDVISKEFRINSQPLKPAQYHQSRMVKSILESRINKGIQLS